MPTKLSAGLLVYRVSAVIEVLLVHPGGPFWARKDDGAWSIPKGEYLADEEPLAAAIREFKEEIGIDPPNADVLELGTIKQPSGKKVTAFAVAGDLDLDGFNSNTFPLEWPPKSGKVQEFPEVDRVEWMPLDRARTKLLKGQVPFLDLLVERLAGPGY
ncbi:NUDIX domain-containing protein [Smaragdicoccus niigatensis]|uniref:NUDIX domain-containing protein n=1 Tax=Smaragdicoccus niigatensis TaxID=359359 RepID=UPI00035E1F36|nr:NUDIX domain-containing protein [Smaragdicoccus niigatensis]